MEDSEETSQSIPIDIGPLQPDQQNTSSSQECQSKRDDVIVIDSDDEEDDDEENEGEQEVCVMYSYLICSFKCLLAKSLFWLPERNEICP